MTSFFLSVQIIYVLVGSTFCLVGVLASFNRRRRGRDLERARSGAAAIVLEDDPNKLDDHYRQLEKLPRNVVEGVLQQLISDTTGEAERRLRVVAEAKGLSKSVARRSRRRAWQRRITAAYLLALLDPASDEVRSLLSDKHPLVRARAIDNLGAAGASMHAELLVRNLSHSAQSVRLAAQQALLRGGRDVVEPVAAALKAAVDADNTPDDLIHLLEVAASIPDPMLVDAMVPFGYSPDPRLRRLVAGSMGGGLHLTPAHLLADLVEDDDGGVRADAARAVGQARVMGLAPKLGRMLSDEQWHVRREAGAALAMIGPPGRVVLRTHLTDEDPFARDMAEHVVGQLEHIGYLNRPAVTPGAFL